MPVCLLPAEQKRGVGAPVKRNRHAVRRFPQPARGIPGERRPNAVELRSHGASRVIGVSSIGRNSTILRAGLNICVTMQSGSRVKREIGL